MKKKALHTSKVKYFYVPKYKTLSAEKMLQFSAVYPEVASHLSEEKDLTAVPRQVSFFLSVLVQFNLSINAPLL